MLDDLFCRDTVSSQTYVFPSLYGLFDTCRMIQTMSDAAPSSLLSNLFPQIRHNTIVRYRCLIFYIWHFVIFRLVVCIRLMATYLAAPFPRPRTSAESSNRVCDHNIRQTTALTSDLLRTSLSSRISCKLELNWLRMYR